MRRSLTVDPVDWKCG